jgi:hypothetical protein
MVATTGTELAKLRDASAQLGFIAVGELASEKLADIAAKVEKLCFATEQDFHFTRSIAGFSGVQVGRIAENCDMALLHRLARYMLARATTRVMWRWFMAMASRAPSGRLEGGATAKACMARIASTETLAITPAVLNTHLLQQPTYENS